MRLVVSAAVAALGFSAVPAEAALIRFVGSGGGMGTFTSGSSFPERRDAALSFDITINTDSFASCGIDPRPCRASLAGDILTIIQEAGSFGSGFTLVFTPTTSGNPFADIGLSFTGTYIFSNLAGGATGISQSGTGTFSATSLAGTGVGRASVFLSAVPEPTTWAMMIAGFGLVGGAMRLRRPASSIA